jgi:hypothetical protein
VINIKTLTEFKKSNKADKNNEVFLADDNALNNKNTLYNKVVSECIKHEIKIDNAKR